MENPVRKSIAYDQLKNCIIMMFASQVIVGHTLPLLSERPHNLVVNSLLAWVNSFAAIIITLTMGVFLLLSLLIDKLKFTSLIVYGVYTLVIGVRTWQFDPYLSVLYCVYSLTGLFLAASIKGASDGNST